MKLLRIRVNGLPLYKNIFDISFCATQRVQSSHLNSVFNLSRNIYINTAEAFVGINASGKTTSLKVISFTSLLLGAVPLNVEYVPQILGEDIKTVFDIDFYENGKIFHLNSEIVRLKQEDGTSRVQILSEKLWEKPISSKLNKKNLFDFDGLNEKQKIAIPVQFDCNKTREEMRRIATKNWETIQGLGKALPRGFDFLELIRDKNECVLWFVFQRRR